MKKFFTYLFVVFGFLFVLEIGALAYLWFADPFGVRPLIDAFTTAPSSVVEDTSTDTAPESAQTPVVDKNPALSPTQEKALETVGIDTAKLPTSITPEMKTCFVGVLGVARVLEIEQGSTPTASEVFATRACYAQ